MPNILITGSDKGLGLAFAQQYAAAGWHVFTTCRRPDRAEALQDLAARRDKVEIHALDVTDHAQIDALAKRLNSIPIDVLLNNAGMYGDEARRAFGNIDYARWEDTLRVNTLAPLKMAEAFLEHVARSERRLIVALSSKMGSMHDNTSGGAYLYRSSKAALNAVYKSLALDLRPHGIGVLIFHPGWVQTDMGGPQALIDPQRSVQGMRRLIEDFNSAHSGHFLSYDGQALPW